MNIEAAHPMDDAGDVRALSPRDQLTAAYDQYAPGLFRYALMITTHHHLAQDALQQAFTKLATMEGRIAEIESLESYLRVAVRNECYRLLSIRRDSPANAVAQDSPAILVPVDAALENDDQRHAIERALRELPAEQREIVHLKVYAGLTFQEIADSLAIPLNTAASRHRYAMERLRQLLEPITKDKV